MSRTSRELVVLTDVLEQLGLHPFLDSGTLLHTFRDGSIPDWDKDIDLGLVANGREPFAALPEALEVLGYYVKLNRYRGLLYTVALKPIATAGPRTPASIHLYFPQGETLWSPQLWERRSTSTHAEVEAGRGRPRARGTLRRALDHVDRALLAETWPLKRRFEAGVWRIPTDLVLPLTSVERHGVRYPVPARTEDYLNARYGDWRRERRDWIFWRDDALLFHERPRRDLIAHHRRRGTAAQPADSSFS